MKLHGTLSRYLAKTYFRNMILLFIALLGIIYLFDTVELIRRSSKSEAMPLSLVLQMGLLKLPEVGQLLFPFAILFSAMYTFWQMTRRYELIVARAAGFSVWQFLAPVMMVAVVVGILQMTIINPLGALLLGRFEELESRYIDQGQSEIAVFKEGLWLRQASDEKGGYVILHADKISQPDWTLHNLNVFFFNGEDDFLRRVNAKTANLEPGFWRFQDTVTYKQGAKDTTSPSMNLPTELTTQDVEESFSSPETMSFWRLPGHIKTLEETGFDASRLKVHYQNLLSLPLMFAAMVLLAATVSMRPPRNKGAFMMIGVGVFIGFFVFFMSSFLQALGSSHQIPVLLAAWSPALISFLLGTAVIMNLEDG